MEKENPGSSVEKTIFCLRCPMNLLCSMLLLLLGYISWILRQPRDRSSRWKRIYGFIRVWIRRFSLQSWSWNNDDNNSKDFGARIRLLAVQWQFCFRWEMQLASIVEQYHVRVNADNNFISVGHTLQCALGISLSACINMKKSFFHLLLILLYITVAAR